MIKSDIDFVLTNQIENTRTSVNHLFFPADAQTRWHRHERDYVIVPMEDATLIMESAEGTKEVSLKRGQCYYRDKGVEHNVHNPNNFAVTLIEVEIK
ncbi:MAG: cupin domain-containing protein [Methylocystaceae bacterium]|nr:cupin domain-containing protein [Methylocystaceae bacterium]